MADEVKKSGATITTEKRTSKTPSEDIAVPVSASVASADSVMGTFESQRATMMERRKSPRISTTPPAPDAPPKFADYEAWQRSAHQL